MLDCVELAVQRKTRVPFSPHVSPHLHGMINKWISLALVHIYVFSSWLGCWSLKFNEAFCFISSHFYQRLSATSAGEGFNERNVRIETQMLFFFALCFVEFTYFSGNNESNNRNEHILGREGKESSKIVVIPWTKLNYNTLLRWKSKT